MGVLTIFAIQCLPILYFVNSSAAFPSPIIYKKESAINPTSDSEYAHYFRSTLYAHVKTVLKQKFTSASTPSDSTIKRIIDKFRTEYSVCDLPRNRHSFVLTEEEREELSERMREEPGMSAAWFHLSGYVNSQNYRIWSTDNPRNKFTHTQIRCVVRSLEAPYRWSYFPRKNSRQRGIPENPNRFHCPTGSINGRTSSVVPARWSESPHFRFNNEVLRGIFWRQSYLCGCLAAKKP